MRGKTSRPYKYKRPRPVEGIITQSINTFYYFYIQTLAFSTPLLSFFVSKAVEDVLSGLPISEHP